jgi:hypothetical protein
MYVELFIILFIIALSFVLCMKDKGYNCQMSHILMGLAVLLIYKVVKYFNLFQKIEPFKQKENFQSDDLTKAINQFIGLETGEISPDTDKAASLTPQQLAIYNQNLADLKTKLSSLQDLLINPPSEAITPDLTNLNSLDLEALQQYQNFQIDYLQKQIQNSQNIINNQNILESSSNYKPIKVFSSCVVNNESNTQSQSLPVNPTNTTVGATSSETGLQTQESSLLKKVLESITVNA